jgi:hypothetical protein
MTYCLHVCSDCQHRIQPVATHVHQIAESACQRRHGHPSVCPHVSVGSHRANFRCNLYCRLDTKCVEKYQIWLKSITQKHSALYLKNYGDIRLTWTHCCATISISVRLTMACSATTYTHDAHANAPQCYVTRTLSNCVSHRWLSAQTDKITAVHPVHSVTHCSHAVFERLQFTLQTEANRPSDSLSLSVCLPPRTARHSRLTDQTQTNEDRHCRLPQPVRTKYALRWDFTQRIMIVFPTFRVNLSIPSQGSSIAFQHGTDMTLEDRIDRLFRNVSNDLPFRVL